MCAPPRNAPKKSGKGGKVDNGHFLCYFIDRKFNCYPREAVMEKIRMKQNLHTHTTFCDGRDTAEDMVLAAIASGLTSIGFSSHANTVFRDSCEMRDKVEEYKREITRLKGKYRGEIDVYLGVELDPYSVGAMDFCGYDYRIASVHYAMKNGEKICYDYSVEHSEDAIKRLCGGSGIEYARLYFEEMANMPKKLSADFVGHFDILTKYEEVAPHLFDTGAPEYRKIALSALDAVREKFEFFEVNAGSIARGYKKTPYPAPFILKRMKEIGCKMLITTDCHSKKQLTTGFDMSHETLKLCGFDEIYLFNGREFVGEKI